MDISVLVALNDSVSSRNIINYITKLSHHPEDWRLTLLHVFKKPSPSEELMGRRFAEERPARLMKLLQNSKDNLVKSGFLPDNISIELATEPYPTITEGIIDRFNKKKYDLVVIGRKKMSKAEEFVMGDVSVKLVRALEGEAVLVVKTG